MSPARLRIIHETNPGKYFPALFELAGAGEVELVGTHRYSVVKEWLRAWLRDRTPLMERSRNALGDLLFRLRIPFVQGETIVMGFAPWDWRLLIYGGLARRNRILYQTSWHDWRFEKTPRRPRPRRFGRYMQRRWHAFVAHPNVRVIAVTPAVARTVRQETGVEAAVIPHAVPEAFFEAGRSRAPRTDGPLRLLFVGEVSEKKGIRVLLGLMARLRDAEVTLTVVGNGPLVPEVRGAADRVTYLGPIYDRMELARVMAEHDILMLLSQRTETWEELFGIVLVEALAAGCAVIASDHVGPRGILEGAGGDGLFEETDASGVQDMLEAMVAERAEVSEFRKKLAPIAEAYSARVVMLEWKKVIEQA